MSPIRFFDHVGITVRDLDTVTAFFVELGFEAEGTDGSGGRVPGNRRWDARRPNRDHHVATARWRDRDRAVQIHPPKRCRGITRPNAQRTGTPQRDVRGRRPSGDPRSAHDAGPPPRRRHRSVRRRLVDGIGARTRGVHRELGSANRLIRRPSEAGCGDVERARVRAGDAGWLRGFRLVLDE